MNKLSPHLLSLFFLSGALCEEGGCERGAVLEHYLCILWQGWKGSVSLAGEGCMGCEDAVVNFRVEGAPACSL